MYEVGDQVRLENTNELKIIVEPIITKHKNLYLCDDDIIYDEDFLYPKNMKLEIKTSLGEKLLISDFGPKEKVLSDFVDVYEKSPKKKRKKIINNLINVIEDDGIDIDVF